MKIRGGYKPKNNFDDDIVQEELFDPMSDIDFDFPLLEEIELEDIIQNEPKCKREW